MAIVVAQGPAVAVGQSFIAHDSFLLRSDATVTASSEDADHEIANGSSWPTYGGGWQTSVISTHSVTVGFPGTRTGQGFALHKHNLGTLGITVKLQTSPDSTVWTDVTGSEQSPADDKTIFWADSMSSSAKFWRILFTGHTSGVMRVAQVFIGPAFQMFNSPGMGWIPPNMALNNEFIMSRSDGGDFLGRSLIRRGGKTNFTMSPVTEAFVRSTWLDFMLAAELHPFYLTWDNVNFPNEVAYCYTEKKIALPRYMTNKHFSVPLSFIALQL